jgi:AbrB family looped-hinge helix DNA binding protein
MRITSKGQVTIPADIREAAGLLPHTEVDFELHDGTVRIVRSGAPKKPSRGAQIVAHLRAHKGDISMTTDEIMALTRGD